MQFHTLDGIDLDSLGIIFTLSLDGAAPVTSTVLARQRVSLPSVVESVSYAPREMAFDVYPDPTAAQPDYDEFDRLVYALFDPQRDTLRHIVGTRTDDDYEGYAAITSFGRNKGRHYNGRILFADPRLRAITPSSSTADPVVVVQDMPAKPILHITDGAALTRKRVTIRDRTGYGFASQIVGFAPGLGGSAADYAVYMDGQLQPFSFDGTRLYWRVSCDAPPTPTWADIYQGSLANTDYANRLNTAGITLNAAALAGNVTTTPGLPGANPLAPALSWQPGMTMKHPGNREYTFGFQGESLRLVDRVATGVREQLDEDADSWTIHTGVEALSISSLTLEVEAGYLAGTNTAGEEAADRVMCIIVASEDRVPSAEHTNDYNPFQPQADSPSAWYVQVQFGNNVFPNVLHDTVDLEDGFDPIDIWDGDTNLDDIPALLAPICSDITTGEDGVYFLRWPPGSYADAEIPFPSFQFHPKPVVVKLDGSGTRIHYLGYESPIEPVLFDAFWVDPDTLEPFEDSAAAAAPTEAIFGQIKASVLYRVRDSELWNVAWEETVTGAAPSGTTETFSNLDLDIAGAVQIAIRLEPIATFANVVSWGELRITSSPVIELQGAKLPEVTVSADIDAQLLTGTIVNNTTEQQLTFTKTISDAGGLEIDTERPRIRGVNGVGPVYAAPLSTAGVRLMDLASGNNDWDTTGAIMAAATIEWFWHERVHV